MQRIFADGADGLAGGITAIASLFFFLLAVHLGQYQLGLNGFNICRMLFWFFNV